MNYISRFFLAIAFLATIGTTAYSQKFQADSQINVTSSVITATNTATVITTKAATLYGIEGANISLSTLFVKFYNAATATCGSGTPVSRYMIPSAGGLSGSNISTFNPHGDIFVNGITMCIVTGLTDPNNIAPAAGAGIINVHWKQGQQ